MRPRVRVAPPAHRADIQGLRALAVVSVILEHSLGWPRGGFVGVDVFFVLSGFLITGLLLREQATSGRISLSMFYRRRARRILPGALAVLLVTVPATWLLFGRGRGVAVAEDAGAALGFFANWHFAAIGTDYFQAGAATSPLQHYWSLSVEEQFYFVWPILMVTLFAVAARRGRLASRRSAFVCVGVLMGTSLAWAMYESQASPTVAYFSTFSRAWELAAGAALAFTTPLLARLAGVVRELLAWSGITLICVSLFVVSGQTGFPAPWAILPTVGTVFIIAAGTGTQPKTLTVLTNPVARYFGDISYSLYLWHFPVLILGGPYLLFMLHSREQSALSVGILFALMAALSAASYHLIERPVLRRRWLLPTDADGLRGYRRRKRRPFVVASTAAVAAAAVLTAAWQLNGLPAHDQFAHAGAATDGSPHALQITGSKAEKALASQITDALAARKWPSDLEPSPENPQQETIPGNTGQCGSLRWQPASYCTFGSPAATKHAILIGDSIAQAYVPALAKIFGSGEWSLRITSMYACPYIDLSIGETEQSTKACAERRKLEQRAVAEAKPDLLIVGNTYFRGKDHSTGSTASISAWHDAFESAMQGVTPSAKQTVVITPPPYDANISQCYSAFAGPQACISHVAATGSNWLEMFGDQARSAKSLHYTLIDSRPWFCSKSGSCPAFVGKLLTKKDTAHPTARYIEYVEPLILAALKNADVAIDGPEPTPPATT